MTKDDILPTSVRLPLDIKEAIAARAEANRRSVSQEVCIAIEYYLDNTPQPKPAKARK